MPDPATSEDALLAHCWGRALPLSRGFMADAAQSGETLVARLEKLLPA